MSNKTYLTERLEKMGLNLADISFPLVENPHDNPSYSEIDSDNRVLFTEPLDKDKNPTGDIHIHYLTEYGSTLQWIKPGSKQPRPFIRTRHAQQKEGQGKYSSPKGSKAEPFITPKVIDAYLFKKEIETLIITEGEFKAIKADQVGLYCIGISGITNYAGEQVGSLHHSIMNVLKRCKVKTLIYLTDADTYTVNYDKNNKSKDLSIRPNSFHSAISGFREAAEPALSDSDFALEKVLFYSINRRFDKEGAKGLDDLLCAYPARTNDIIQNLTETFGVHSEFFAAINLTAWNKVDKKLHKDFGLYNVDSFYKVYQEYIGDNEFVFKGRRYQWNSEKVEYLGHEDSKLYMRVGTDWYKEIDEPVPGHENKSVKVIAKWTKGALMEDYKNYKGFIDDLPRYDGFTVEPMWTGGYRRKVGKFFNLMNPIEHSAQEGPITNTLKFLKHIFGGEATIEKPIARDPFTVAIDWLTLLITRPMQQLPVPILVSVENGTGKSTFLYWLKMIFTSNAVIMNNQQFAMSFNAHYASKYIIGIDEGFLEVDKKSEKERIKQLATAKDIMIQFKGADLRSIPYYGKLIICSNDADRVMKIDDGETRWFVVKVNPIPQDLKDPDLLIKMEKEIPAFLHFISSREMFHKKKDRLWFAPEDFITDQFKKIVENTKNRLDKVVESFIKETFLTFKQSPLHIPNKQLVELINKTAKYKLDETDLRDYLKKRDMKTNPKGSQRFRFPFQWQKDMTGGLEIGYIDGVGRFYEFRAEEWLSAEELEEFNKPLDVAYRDENGDPKQPSQLELEMEKAQKGGSPW